MHGMTDWHGKDDLDLTAEDITAMVNAGTHVQAGGPHLPGEAVVVTALATYSPGTLAVAPSPLVMASTAQVTMHLSTV